MTLTDLVALIHHTRESILLGTTRAGPPPETDGQPVDHDTDQGVMRMGPQAELEVLTALSHLELAAIAARKAVRYQEAWNEHRD